MSETTGLLLYGMLAPPSVRVPTPALAEVIRARTAMKERTERQNSEASNGLSLGTRVGTREDQTPVAQVKSRGQRCLLHSA